MTRLDQRALASLPLSRADVKKLYDMATFGGCWAGLCESHERLRAELDGSAELHNESAAVFRRAAGEIGEYRDGLLRIFARCEDWSAADLRADVADLLGLSVAECERLTTADLGEPRADTPDPA